MFQEFEKFSLTDSTFDFVGVPPSQNNGHGQHHPHQGEGLGGWHQQAKADAEVDDVLDMLNDDGFDDLFPQEMAPTIHTAIQIPSMGPGPAMLPHTMPGMGSMGGSYGSTSGDLNTIPPPPSMSRIPMYSPNGPQQQAPVPSMMPPPAPGQMPQQSPGRLGANATSTASVTSKLASATSKAGAPSVKKEKADADKDDDSSNDDDGESDPSSKPKKTRRPKLTPEEREARRQERLVQRRMRKSQREKERRSQENSLFEELANLCNLPPDQRDKASVLQAVIEQIQEENGGELSQEMSDSLFNMFDIQPGSLNMNSNTILPAHALQSIPLSSESTPGSVEETKNDLESTLQTTEQPLTF